MNRTFLSIVRLAVCFVLYSCSVIRHEKFDADKINNLHSNDPSLGGITIYQLPGSPEDAIGYSENSHPAVIQYYFWNGRSRTVEYSPTGKVIGSVWTDANQNEANIATEEFWRDVDFRYGSDPLLERHPNIQRAK